MSAARQSRPRRRGPGGAEVGGASGLDGRCQACGRRRCPRCGLAVWLRELLDDGSGRLSPRLAPLAEHLVVRQRPSPKVTRRWLREHEAARALLADMARGAVPVEHASLERLEAGSLALRRMLTDSGVLAPAPQRRCARCGAARSLAARWPDGAVCGPCRKRALTRTVGVCGGCGREGVRPGLGGRGEPVCARCAGITCDLRCRGCGVRAFRVLAGLCARCSVRARLEELFGVDGAATRPVLEAIVARPNPASVFLLLSERKLGPVLRDLARLGRAVGHPDLDAHPARAVAHLRAILVEARVLPWRDEQMAAAERWAAEVLTAARGRPWEGLLRQYVTFGCLAPLRHRAAEGALPPDALAGHQRRVAHVVALVTWLAGQDADLASCGQARLDSYVAGRPGSARPLRAFIAWCGRAGYCPRTLGVARPARAAVTPTPHAERARMLGRLAGDETLPGWVRVGGLIHLLFAQPITVVARLPVAAVRTSGADAWVRVGPRADEIRLPPVFAAVVAAYLAERDAAAGPWLFPGRRPGLPATAGALRRRLKAVGVSPQTARAASVRHLALHAPPAVLAPTLGLSVKTAATHWHESGAVWTAYPAARRPRG